MTAPTTETMYETIDDEQPTRADESVVDKTKELIREGNRRRLVVKSADGRNLVEIPLTIAVIAAVLLPVWIAIGVIVAIFTDASIHLERPEN